MVCLGVGSGRHSEAVIRPPECAYTPGFTDELVQFPALGGGGMGLGIRGGAVPRQVGPVVKPPSGVHGCRLQWAGWAGRKIARTQVACLCGGGNRGS